MHRIRTRAAAALAVAALTVPALAHAEPLSVEEIVTLDTVTAAELSPNGQFIAYILQVPREPYVDDAGPARRELHVVDRDGDSRAFVTGDVGVRDIAWSADGGRIYYLAERDDDEHVSLYEIPVDGGESRRVYAHETAMSDIEPSPDGARMLFLASEPPPESAEELEQKGFDAVVYEESAKPTHVFVLDLAAEEPSATRAELEGSASAVRFAPDGERYAVALAPTPLIDDFYVSRDLYVVETATSRVVGRIEHEGKLGAFAFSPDGSRIAFIGAADPSDPLEGRIFVAPAEGGAPRRVTQGYPGHFETLFWRGDDTLEYTAARGAWTQVGTLDVDGEFTVPAPPDGGPIVRSVDSRPGVEHVAVVADTPAHPREVYVYSEREGFRRLTRSNPILDDRDLAPQEVVRYEARDGLELSGVLVRPLDVREGRRHPLVIAVHGGPESRYANGWVSGYTFPAQAMAGDGYAFFYPNYRASTGRGVEFSKLDQGDPAGPEFDDLVDAKTHLVEMGLVDVGRVGVSGGSYGGYATMWAATALTEHFAAGVAFVGISNLIGKVGTSDIPQELFQVHYRAWPWEDWQFWLERSPIFHAGRSETPLLILGGTADTRVDPSQSLQMYRYMKLRTETPVRLVRYPGEGHGNAATAAQLDYALRMQRWMDHYLQGPGGEPPPYELDHAARLEAAPEAEDDAEDGAEDEEREGGPSG